MTLFLGIDPGKSGGAALITPDGRVVDTQTFTATERDIKDWFGDVGRLDGVHAIIERVAAFPKQGVASTFKFGQSYGFLRGMLIAHEIPFESVPPGRWQRFIGCLSGGDKNVTKSKAQELFPQVKVTHAIADALLLSEYCRRMRNE